MAPASPDTTDDPKSLYAATRRAVGQSLFHAMQVANADQDGPAKLTQEALAERSGVARSTIAKYLAAKDDASVNANPDLDTLCRLATVLNVSPALLLLTPDDWKSLASAAILMLQAVDDPQVQQIVDELGDSRTLRAAERGEGGLRIAERAALCTRSPVNQGDAHAPMRAELVAQQQARQTHTLRAITVASAIAPLHELPPEFRAPLLWMCASLGASAHPSK